MFDNHTILLFWPENKQTFRMFSLRDLRFLITHKSTRSENPISRISVAIICKPYHN